MPNTTAVVKPENSGKAGSRSEAPTRREKHVFGKRNNKSVRQSGTQAECPGATSSRLLLGFLQGALGQESARPDPLWLREMAAQQGLCFPSHKFKDRTENTFN